MSNSKSTGYALASAIAIGLLSGCASTSSVTATDDLAQLQSALAEERARTATLEQQLQSRQQPPAIPAGADDLFPPSPKPGHCYARVLIPAQFETTSEQVLVRDASEEIDVVPAQYEWAEEQVLDTEGYTRLEVVPAVYETVTEQVLVKPASKKFVEVPAVYETVEERVVDVPAHTEWKRGPSPLAGALQSKVDQSTGEIVCLVEVPATYKTITRTVLASPARVEEAEIPAEYETVTKTVLKTPETTREIVVPPTYATVRVQKEVRPAQETRTPIPAEYDTVTSSRKVSDEDLVWREVVCATNMTPELANALQTGLREAGYYRGPMDSIFGPQTMSAATRYANERGLPAGTNYVTMETLDALGVSM